MRKGISKKLPNFKNEEEEAKFWATHSSADYWDEFEDVEEPIELEPELKKRIMQNANKRLLTLRLEPYQIDVAKKIARRKSIGYQTLMRMWISEGIKREVKLIAR